MAFAPFSIWSSCNSLCVLSSSESWLTHCSLSAQTGAEATTEGKKGGGGNNGLHLYDNSCGRGLFSRDACISHVFPRRMPLVTILFLQGVIQLFVFSCPCSSVFSVSGHFYKTFFSTINIGYIQFLCYICDSPTCLCSQVPQPLSSASDTNCALL